MNLDLKPNTHHHQMCMPLPTLGVQLEWKEKEDKNKHSLLHQETSTEQLRINFSLSHTKAHESGWLNMMIVQQPHLLQYKTLSTLLIMKISCYLKLKST